MLKSPEQRIGELKFPKSYQDRVRRNRRHTRKNKWVSKFRGLMRGSSSKRWTQQLVSRAGREKLEHDSHGTAKVKPVLVKKPPVVRRGS